MTVHAADLANEGHGRLYDLDPRTKLGFAALTIALCVISGRAVVLAGAFLFTQGVMVAGGVPASAWKRAWRVVGPLAAIILIVQPLLAPGSDPALAEFGPLRLTAAGLLLGLRYALRIAAAAFAVLVVVATTQSTLLVRGLQKLGLPYPWAMTIGLALRYLGIVGELYSTIREAQQARGWDPGRGGLIRRALAVVPTLIAVIVAALRLSDTLALGLAARGFGLAGRRIPRTVYRDIVMGLTDWAVLAGTCVLFAAGLIFSL
jgi:energy-coupling factor transporter transmembrane protein EcfT